MGPWIEKLPAQPVRWRLFAAIILLLLVVMALSPRPIMPGAGLNMAGAKAVYWSCAILGLVGYAYGFRVLPRMFWRIYALLFTIEIGTRFMLKVAWPAVMALFGLTEASRHGPLMILFGLGLIVTTCLALLRYGGWLKASVDRSSPPSLESIFS